VVVFLLLSRSKSMNAPARRISGKSA